MMDILNRTILFGGKAIVSALDITVRFDGDKAHVRIGENYSNQVTELECPLTKRP